MIREPMRSRDVCQPEPYLLFLHARRESVGWQPRIVGTHQGQKLLAIAFKLNITPHHLHTLAADDRRALPKGVAVKVRYADSSTLCHSGLPLDPRTIASW